MNLEVIKVGTTAANSDTGAQLAQKINDNFAELLNEIVNNAASPDDLNQALSELKDYINQRIDETLSDIAGIQSGISFDDEEPDPNKVVLWMPLIK